MKILIVSQNENVYLPSSFGYICQELDNDVAAIVEAPAMSTHKGPIKGLIKHMKVFGLWGTFLMVNKILKAKTFSLFSSETTDGPWYSLRHVAQSFHIPFHRVNNLSSSEFENLIEKMAPDLLISMSCPQVIRKKIRDMFPAGCINVHGAPLPRYRGLMPAFWILLNDESHAAATVHVLDAKLDDGSILAQEKVDITPSETWDSLVRKTKRAGAKALVEVIRSIKEGTQTYSENREEDATYFSFPTRKDAREFHKKGKRFF